MALTVPAVRHPAAPHRAVRRPAPALLPAHQAQAHPVRVHPVPVHPARGEANSATGMALYCRFAVIRLMAGDGKATRVAWGPIPVARNPARMALSAAAAVHHPAGPTPAPVTGMAPAIRSVLTHNQAGAGKITAVAFPHRPATVNSTGFSLKAINLRRACPGFLGPEIFEKTLSAGTYTSNSSKTGQ